MNILKAYSSTLQRNIDFDEFVKSHYCNILSMNKTTMQVKMKDGTVVLFKVFDDIEEAYKQVAGYRFQYIDFVGTFDKEVKNYLLSRVR